MEIHRLDIERLVHNRILGIITPEEEAVLNEWLKEKSHQECFDHLMNASQLADRYTHYSHVDAEKAWQKFVENEGIGSEKPAIHCRRTNLLKYAAAILVLLVAGSGYWYSQYTKVTPPEIPAAVQLAMQQSIESGKQEAEISEVRDSDLSGERFRGERGRGESMESSTGEQVQEMPLTTEELASLTKDQLLAARRITTMHDKEYWVTLEDGTLVHLNYNTRLIYPEKFGRGNRNVILDGEAFFMVAKDKSRRFVVHTQQGEVKVYGTEFYVNTRSKALPSQTSARCSAATSVVLVKGSISVTPTEGREQMLKPGQKLSILNSQYSIEEADVAPYVAWNEGEFVFADVPLEDLLGTMSRWYQVEVEFAKEEARHMLFTGTIDRYGSADVILHSISKVTGLEIEKNGNHVIIK